MKAGYVPPKLACDLDAAPRPALLEWKPRPQLAEGGARRAVFALCGVLQGRSRRRALSLTEES